MNTFLAESGPIGYVLILGTLVALAGLRTRLSAWCLCLGVVILAVGAQAACFDGRPHVTEKLDATVFIWARVVSLRLLIGVLVLALAVPIGHAAGQVARVNRGWLGGLLVVGGFGLGLLGSGLVLQWTLRSAFSAASAGDVARFHSLLRHGVTVSSSLMLGAAVVTAIGAIGMAVSWWRTTSTFQSSQGRETAPRTDHEHAH